VWSFIRNWPEGLFILLSMLPLAFGLALGDWRVCLGSLVGLLVWGGIVWLAAAIHDRGREWREAAPRSRIRLPGAFSLQSAQELFRSSFVRGEK
jgi:hypothetical protein